MTPDLEELKKLAEAATQGEWSCGRDPSHFDAPELVKPDGAFYVGVKMEDAAFIAAANPAAILALIERCERAEGALEDQTARANECGKIAVDVTSELDRLRPALANARAAAFAEAIEAVRGEYLHEGRYKRIPFYHTGGGNCERGSPAYEVSEALVAALTSLKDKPNGQ